MADYIFIHVTVTDSETGVVSNQLVKRIYADDYNQYEVRREFEYIADIVAPERGDN